ncbi:MAG: type II toxin-antitoxin system RelE/ParE family toxin [Desulfitobacteriaceae bacterium]
MGKFKVKIYSNVKIDLKDIVNYLNTLSPQAAIKYYDQIVEEIGGLAEMPERCSFVRDVALKAKGYRYLIVENYLVFFVVKADTVQIRRILYGKRNYEWLLSY